ncbi:MAG TPA: hypothetical protein VFM25_05265 [Verrucomicrobiae bacterium]|nr:hypothetical protein [Verrucomicrobiae bacterium]
MIALRLLTRANDVVLFSIFLAGAIAAFATALFLFLRWISWWKLGRLLFGLACLATLVALFYAEEDVRGKWAWANFKKKWEAKGEKFELSKLAPPPVPDEQNFAMAQIVASSYGSLLDKNGNVIRPPNTNIINRLRMQIDVAGLKTPAIGHDWRRGTNTDLKEWQTYFRNAAGVTNWFSVPAEPQSPAADVLLALSRYDSTIEELRNAAQRPYSRFPLTYNSDNPASILLPHLATLKQATPVLSLRAIAETELGETEKSLADIKLILRLTESVRTEPILISHLVRISMLDFAFQPIWEGFTEHKWSDAQLAALEQDLSNLDFLSDYHFVIRGEAALNFGEIDYLRRTRKLDDLYHLGTGASSEFNAAVALSHFIPSGWFYRNEIRTVRFEMKWYLPIVNLKSRTVSPGQVRAASDAVTLETASRNPYNFLEHYLLPAIADLGKKFAIVQTDVDEARVACALERFRLAHGNYPDSLDLLAPQFIQKIPNDIISGKPLRYRKNADASCVIYSIGWNETDDGGSVVLKKNSETRAIDPDKGDWVWKILAF